MTFETVLNVLQVIVGFAVLVAPFFYRIIRAGIIEEVHKIVSDKVEKARLVDEAMRIERQKALDANLDRLFVAIERIQVQLEKMNTRLDVFERELIKHEGRITHLEHRAS